MNPVHSTPRAAPQAGFTLIELMIAVAVVALLMSVALPSFMDSFRKGRRSDAVAGIAAVQQAQERWRASHPNFTTSFVDLQLATTAARTIPSPRGHYNLELNVPTASASTDYEVIATAIATGSQANDGSCKVMGVQVRAGQVTFGSGPSSPITYPDANRCWAQ